MNDKNMNEKINSMMQIPLTINQYFFEKNIDKINVTFEREEDMILLLLNIFVHNFIHDYYFNDIMIQELLTILPKNHSLLKDYQDFPFIRESSVYHSDDFDEKAVTSGYYEKLYEDSEKDESWKKMLDNQEQKEEKEKEQEEIVGGSNEEAQDIDYSKVVESVRKHPNFLLMFSTLLNYVVSFLDCYNITVSFKTNIDKSNSMNAVVYNNIDSTFIYLIDFLKNNVSEDQPRALLVSKLLSLLHDAYSEYYKENNSDFFENSMDVLTSEEVFELFVMKLVTSNTEQQGGNDEVKEEVKEEDLVAPREEVKEEELVAPREEVKEEELVAPTEEVKEEELVAPTEEAKEEPLQNEIEEVKEEEIVAPTEEIKEEPLQNEMEEVKEETIRPTLESRVEEEVLIKTEKNNNNLITIITQGMFLKLGIWQNIFTKLKEPDTHPSFDSLSVEKITKENLEEVYSNNELLIDEIMILKPFLLDVTPSIVVSANKIDEQLLKNMNDFYQHFSIKQKGGSDEIKEEEEQKDNEVDNKVVNEVVNEVEEPLEKELVPEQEETKVDELVNEEQELPNNELVNEVEVEEEQREEPNNELKLEKESEPLQEEQVEVEKEIVPEEQEDQEEKDNELEVEEKKVINKKLIQNLKNISIKPVKTINNLYDLLEENVVEVKNKNDTLYESAPKYKFIINDSSSNLEKTFDIYKFLNRGTFCPGGSIMNSYNNCSLSSDYVKEVGSTNFALSFKNDERELSYGGTVLFYNDDTRYQINTNIDFRLTIDSDIAIINTNMLESADADDLMSRIVYRSTVECVKNLIYQNMVISEEDLTNPNETLLKEKMQMQTFWSLLSNISHFNELIASTVMQNMGNFLQECEGILKWGGFINKFNTIVDSSNTFIVENSVTPILRSVSQESMIIPYDADGNALRLYVQKDISSAFRSIYMLLNATEGYNEHSIAGYETLLVARGDTKGKVIYINDEQLVEGEEESNKFSVNENELGNLEEFEPQPEEELQNGLEEQDPVVNELQEEEIKDPVVNEIKEEIKEEKEEPLLDSVVEKDTKEVEEKGGRSSLKKKPSKRKYNTRNKKSNKKRNKKNTKGKNSKEKKKGKSKTQKRKKVNK